MTDDRYGSRFREAMKESMEHEWHSLNRRKQDHYEKTVCWLSFVCGIGGVLVTMAILGHHFLHWFK